MALGETSIDKHLQILNETMVNYFGKRTDGKAVPTLVRNNTIQCQLCSLEEHITFACSKLTDLGPKCAKCGGVHKTKNYGLKCSFCSGMGHTKDQCWKNNGKGPSTAIFLEVMVDDEKVIIIELNCCVEQSTTFSLVSRCIRGGCPCKHPHMVWELKKHLAKKVGK